MDCKAFRSEIEASETEQAVSPAARAHLIVCEACRAFRSERLSLNHLIRGLGTVTAPPDFDFKLRARLAAARTAGPLSRRRTLFAPGPGAIAVAASLVVLIAALAIYRQLPSRPLSPAVTVDDSNTAKNVEQPPQQRDTAIVSSIAESGGGSHAGDETTEGPAGERAQTASAVQQKPGPERLARAKSAGRMTPPKAVRASVLSNELAFGGNAQIITRTGANTDGGTRVPATAANPLQVSSQPVRVMLHDRQGAMRSVSLEPVIFGSQDFLRRTASEGKRPADDEGIW